MGLESVTIREMEFLHLRVGGFFETILKHPEVELYRTKDGTFVMRIPGAGAVQVAERRFEVNGICPMCDKPVPPGFYMCNGNGSHPAIERRSDMDKPKIITLCGSTRFTPQMLDEAWRLTKLENIVIHWNILNGSSALSHGAESEGDEVKEIIDRLYLHKVAMADEVRVINVGGYIGNSTRSELRHAQKLGKKITWLEPDKADKEFA